MVGRDRGPTENRPSTTTIVNLDAQPKIVNLENTLAEILIFISTTSSPQLFSIGPWSLPSIVLGGQHNTRVSNKKRRRLNTEELFF